MNKRSNIYWQILLSVLSLASSCLVFSQLYVTIQQNNRYHYPHDPYTLIVFFGIFLLFNAVGYWLLKINFFRILQNFLLIINFVFAILLGIGGLDLVPSKFSYYQPVIFLTVVLGLIYLNWPRGSNRKEKVQFFFKLFASLIVILVDVYLFIMVTIGGNTFLVMSPAAMNWSLAGIGLLMLLNIAFAVFVWLKSFRSWWAWLCSILFIIELICLFLISGAWQFFL